MEIAYAAHTESCTFLLDADGICRWVVAAVSRAAVNGHFASGPLPAHAERCIGAQYVASIALGAKGGLIEAPKPGAPLLFARIEANGRIALVRTGALVRFEEKVDSGVRRSPNPEDNMRDTRPNLPDDVLDSFMAKLPSSDEDEERTTPYKPSHGKLQSARPSTRAPAPSSSATLPRLPAPPRMPAGMSGRTSDVPPTARSTRFPPAPITPIHPIRVPAAAIPPSYPPPSRRPSVIRVSAPNWDAIEALPRARRAR